MHWGVYYDNEKFDKEWDLFMVKVLPLKGATKNRFFTTKPLKPLARDVFPKDIKVSGL